MAFVGYVIIYYILRCLLMFFSLRPSGSGKSTSVALVQRLYDALGEVLIDGQNIKEYNLTWLREQIGLVGYDKIMPYQCTISFLLFFQTRACSL